MRSPSIATTDDRLAARMIQGPLFSKTRTSTFAQHRSPAIIRTDPDEDAVVLVDMLKAEFPREFEMVSFPRDQDPSLIDLRPYFDEDEIQRQGSRMLRWVLLRISSLNAKRLTRVQTLGLEWRTANQSMFDRLEYITADVLRQSGMNDNTIDEPLEPIANYLNNLRDYYMNQNTEITANDGARSPTVETQPVFDKIRMDDQTPLKKISMNSATTSIVPSGTRGTIPANAEDDVVKVSDKHYIANQDEAESLQAAKFKLQSNAIEPDENKPKMGGESDTGSNMDTSPLITHSETATQYRGGNTPTFKLGDHTLARSYSTASNQNIHDEIPLALNMPYEGHRESFAEAEPRALSRYGPTMRHHTIHQPDLAYRDSPSSHLSQPQPQLYAPSYPYDGPQFEPVHFNPAQNVGYSVQPNETLPTENTSQGGLMTFGSANQTRFANYKAPPPLHVSSRHSEISPMNYYSADVHQSEAPGSTHRPLEPPSSHGLYQSGDTMTGAYQPLSLPTGNLTCEQPQSGPASNRMLTTQPTSIGDPSQNHSTTLGSNTYFATSAGSFPIQPSVDFEAFAPLFLVDEACISPLELSPQASLPSLAPTSEPLSRDQFHPTSRSEHQQHMPSQPNTTLLDGPVVYVRMAAACDVDDAIRRVMSIPGYDGRFLRLSNEDAFVMG